MACCPSSDQLLRLILARIGDPKTMPNSFLTTNGNQPSGTSTVSSLMDFHLYALQRFDEIMGEFEITVNIVDSDLTQQGNQPKTIRLPNLGEAVAELMTLQTQQSIYTNVILQMLNDALIEIAQIKQTDVINYHHLLTINEYMGINNTQVNIDMPLSYTPNQETFADMLQPSTLKVTCNDYQQQETLSQDMQSLLQAAAIIRAVHFRKLPTDQAGMLAQITQDLTDMFGGITPVSNLVQNEITNIQNQYNQSSGGSS
jgi:hypothetical protein